MSLTLAGWLVVFGLIAILALLVTWLRAKVSRVTSSGKDLPGAAGPLAVAAMASLVVAGLGAVASYMRGAFDVAGPEHAISSPLPATGPDGEMLARLKNYTHSIGSKAAPARPAQSKRLPDVNTMMKQLAARLEANPKDVNGWRMLGWSYFNTARYEEAAAAYAKAVKLDPRSSELKQAHELAKAKSAEPDKPTAPQAPQPAKARVKGDQEDVDKGARPKTTQSRTHDPAIRSMVDGLAKRLARSPRDVAGWTRLMRSRVVLGEKEVALSAFRKALDIFKDDSAASGKITAAAIELGLDEGSE